jgi:hypothetical protein
MRSPGVRISKRMPAKLHELKGELMQRRHQPVPEQGRWLASVVHEHCAYYAVPGNSKAVASTHTITCAPPPTGMQWCRHTESADMCSKANRALDTARSTN